MSDGVDDGPLTNESSGLTLLLYCLSSGLAKSHGPSFINYAGASGLTE